MTVTQLEARRRPRLRALAVTAAGALAFAGLGVVNAATANAEILNASGGSLQWGLKSSLLNYHFAMHLGTTQGVTQGDGATASTTTRGSGSKTYPAFWNFPFVSGSYDSATQKYTAQYGGFVALTESNPAPSAGPGTASPFKYFKVANPKVVVDLSNNTKQLVLDVQPGADDGPAEPSGPISEDVDFATFPNLNTAAGPTGGEVTYSNVAAALTADGSAAFGGFYGEGTEVDPVSTSLTGLTGGGGDPTPTPSPTPPGEGEQSITFTVPDIPEECAGEVIWSISEGADSQVTMTEAALSGDHLLSTGEIDPISVTDGRTGDAETCFSPFGISGQVSQFTGSAGTLPGNYLGWTPNVTGAGLTAGAPVASGFVANGTMGPGLSAASPLATADGAATPAADTGEAGADLELKAPVDSEPGSYQATLTITGMS